MSWKNGHWPDCYVNHGPPDATCDMGPECGTVRPADLTDEMVRALRVPCPTCTAATGTKCVFDAFERLDGRGVMRDRRDDVHRTRVASAAAVTPDTLTAEQIDGLLRRLVDIPGIFEQPRNTPEQRLMTACFAGIEYHDRHWILDSRYREAATLICDAINAAARSEK